ncbi:hypothetical protein VOI54_14725 [Tamlana sp. 2201CG12-4]|uniref:hypothetical protein n=1 Tax=Tamlana sp. 2201CG12-4 TaxID=3112582 RepID=UPI002DBB6B69|nr:hypothetical protein [Tamlana sp. 2201CG12-4]MEC3908281.1 hypothetical protein [Tamlana sp. 2201CG12-4]
MTCILFMVLCVYQSTYSISYSQKPDKIRAFEEGFKSRYRSNTYNYEGISIVTETPSGSGNYEDYKNGKTKVKEQNNNQDFSINLGPLSWLFYLAIILAVIYLVYILLNEGSNGLFASNKNRNINTYTDITAENIENVDIQRLIKNAENNNDYRLAIRYYYLLVLKTLSLNNYIKFEDDKTNSEYLNEINDNDKVFNNEFAYTSYLYNYIWYGKFPLNKDKYRIAKHNFVSLLKQVKP